MAQELVVKPYPAELAAKPAIVAVTGCTGFIASAIVERLLALGHTVHGTCRDMGKAKDLQLLPGASERLKLFAADLLQPGSFDAAFDGCGFVVHAASPCINQVPPGQGYEKLIKPAVEGTENVLASVNRITSVRCVVLTSSMAAVRGSPIERGEGHVFTEQDWSIVPSEHVLPYFCSKREAEKKAWEIAEKQSRWDLVAINPAIVLGPPATGRPDGESVGIIRKATNNAFASACPNMSFGTVDVRDVAAAHTLALFTPGAKGRYLCIGACAQLREVITDLSELYPGLIRPPGYAPPKWLLWLLAPLLGITRDLVTHNMNFPTVQVSNQKVRDELGLTFLPRKTTLRDQVEKMKQLGLLPGFKG